MPGFEIRGGAAADCSRNELKAGINRVVNKLNISNIKQLVQDLFRLNIVRGRGLFARSVMRAQISSPSFTNVYAALIAIVNSHIPEVGSLLCKRLILQFRRSYRRNDKLVCGATCKFLAHLRNQKVISELLILEIASLFLSQLSDSSVELCCSLVLEAGATLSSESLVEIFDQFRTILHESKVEKRVTYLLEDVFTQRRLKFRDFPSVVSELDLIPDDDQYEHDLELDDEFDGEDQHNFFQVSENHEEEEGLFQVLSKKILGDEEPEDDSSEDSENSQPLVDFDEPKQKEEICDFTEEDVMNLRRTIYLCFSSSLSYEECAHKLLKLKISQGQEKELCLMFIDCCAMEKTFSTFFPFGARRLCELEDIYRVKFGETFVSQYRTCHRLETARLRNVAKFFAHLFLTDSLPWELLREIRLTEETTTSSSRIFIKIMFQEMAEHAGIEVLHNRIRDSNYKEYLENIFPRDTPRNIRFAINFFTAIGLGILTENLRKFFFFFSGFWKKTRVFSSLNNESQNPRPPTHHRILIPKTDKHI